MLEYHVTARRLDSHGSEAKTKAARITLDTDMAGRDDAFNPAEMLLASLAACLLKGAERVTPVLGFDLRGIDISLHGVRQDNPPKMSIGIQSGPLIGVQKGPLFRDVSWPEAA